MSMKIPPIKSPTSFASKTYSVQGLLILSLCFGLALSGCSRFEFNQAKSNAEKMLKQPTLAEKPCPADNSALASDLVSRLDDTLLKTKESKTWPFSEYDRCKRKMPYHFTVISVSPIVVIGAPITKLSGATFAANSLAINCLRSKKFMGYYEVDNQLANARGLVWFSPEHGPRLFDVPSHANSIFLMISGQSVRLKRKGDLWVVSNKR
jgi:hypothetical protein